MLDMSLTSLSTLVEVRKVRLNSRKASSHTLKCIVYHVASIPEQHKKWLHHLTTALAGTVQEKILHPHMRLMTPPPSLTVHAPIRIGACNSSYRHAVHKPHTTSRLCGGSILVDALLHYSTEHLIKAELYLSHFLVVDKLRVWITSKNIHAFQCPTFGICAAYVRRCKSIPYISSKENLCSMIGCCVPAKHMRVALGCMHSGSIHWFDWFLLLVHTSSSKKRRRSGSCI